MDRSLAKIFTAAPISALALMACQTAPTSSQLMPAMLMESSPETTALLSEAVSSALGGRKITLAPNVLMTGSKLTLDPKYVDSRSLQRPDHFILMKDGKRCYLQHEESGKMMPLGKLKCQIA